MGPRFRIPSHHPWPLAWEKSHTGYQMPSAQQLLEKGNCQKIKIMWYLLSLSFVCRKKLMNFDQQANAKHWWIFFWVMRAGFLNSHRHPRPFHLCPTTIPGPQDRATVGPKHNLPPNWNHKGTNFHVSRAYKCPLPESAGYFPVAPHKASWCVRW